MSFSLTDRDRERLKGVHPDLARIIELTAATGSRPFAVVEGCRTRERQAQLFARGASKTMNSRHIPAQNGLGHAVDIAPLDDGQISWSWPDYYPLAKEVKATAAACKIPIEWGGDWKSFKDGPHWQLPWKDYPGTVAPRAPVPVPTPMPDGETDPIPVPMPQPRPDDPGAWPKEYEQPTPGKSTTIWSVIGQIFSALGAGAAYMLSDWRIMALLLALIIFAALWIGKERIRKMVDDRV